MHQYGFGIVILLLLSVAQHTSASQKEAKLELTTNTLYVQLQWYLQASASSVWLPSAIGFYSDEGVTVAVNQGGPNIDTVRYVQSGVADIGFGWLQPTLRTYLYNDSDQEMVVIAQIDQTSSQRLVTLRSSGIDSLEKLEGKRVCVWAYTFLSPVAALSRQNISFFQVVLGSTPYPLLAGTCDAVQVMTYNELGLLYQMTNPATGDLVKPNDLYVLELPDAAFAMEDTIFVKRQWLNDFNNLIRLKSFLRAVVKTGIYIRDYPKQTLPYYNPSSNIDEWQLYYTNLLAWHNASQTNTYGRVNLNQVQQTIKNVILYAGFENTTLDASYIFDNQYIDAVVSELKSEGYIFDKELPNVQLTWCRDLGAQELHVCRGDEKYPQVQFYDKPKRIAALATSSICAFATLLVLAATIYHRKKRAILIASPNYLYLMLIGALVMYIGTIVYNLGVSVSSCHIYIWCISIGFTLLFAPFICKTWRIRKIFRRSIARRGESPIPYATLMISAVVVNVILLIVFSTLTPIATTPVKSPFDPYVLYPTCHWNKTIGYVLIGFTCTLLVISAWFAFLVRNVGLDSPSLKIVNESREMSTAITMTCFLVIIFLILALSQSNPNATLLLQAFGVCMVCASNTILVFAKKLYHCYTLSASQMKKLYVRSSTTASSAQATSTVNDTTVPESTISTGVASKEMDPPPTPIHKKRRAKKAATKD